MNTATLAKELGKHYQAVSRIVRRIQKQDGTWNKHKRSASGFELSTELEARVREALAKLEPIPEEIRSSERQRRSWLEVWNPAFLKAKREDWTAYCVVVAAIDHTKIPGWVSKPLGRGTIGGFILTQASQFPTDIGVNGEWTGLTKWLLDNGFKVDSHA